MMIMIVVGSACSQQHFLRWLSNSMAREIWKCWSFRRSWVPEYPRADQSAPGEKPPGKEARSIQRHCQRPKFKGVLCHQASPLVDGQLPSSDGRIPLWYLSPVCQRWGNLDESVSWMQVPRSASSPSAIQPHNSPWRSPRRRIESIAWKSALKTEAKDLSQVTFKWFRVTSVSVLGQIAGRTGSIAGGSSNNSKWGNLSGLIENLLRWETKAIPESTETYHCLSLVRQLIEGLKIAGVEHGL